MEFNEYQEKSREHAFYPGKDSEEGHKYLVLGLTGEAGELAEHYKHALRDDGGVLTDETKYQIRKELGDVLWYLANIAAEMGVPLEEVAIEGLKKIEGRLERGTLKGRGGDR